MLKLYKINLKQVFDVIINFKKCFYSLFLWDSKFAATTY